MTDIWKDLPQWTEQSYGGFSGREPGVITDRNEKESMSIHNVNQPEHVNKPYTDKVSEAFDNITKPIRGHSWEEWDTRLQREGYNESQRGKIIGSWEKDKSDVEHGMYGGISTDQEPLEAAGDKGVVL